MNSREIAIGWAIMMTLLIFMDHLFTSAAIAKGIPEANPIVNWFASHWLAGAVKILLVWIVAALLWNRQMTRVISYALLFVLFANVVMNGTHIIMLSKV